MSARSSSVWRRSIVFTGVLGVAAVALNSEGSRTADAGTVVRSGAPAAPVASRPASLVRATTAAAAGPVCPASTFPDPATGKGSYAIAFRATITKLVLNAGWNEQPDSAAFPDINGWQGTVTGGPGKTSWGTVCGLLEVPSLDVVVAASGIVFNTRNTAVNLLLGGASLSVGDRLKLLPSGTLHARVSGVDPDGTLQATATADAGAEIYQGKGGTPFQCAVDLSNAPVTTGTSTEVPDDTYVHPNERRNPDDVYPPGSPEAGDPVWTVTGKPVSGPLAGATATIVGNAFAVPAFEPTGVVAPFGPTTCGASTLFNIALNGSMPTANGFGAPYRPYSFYLGPGAQPDAPSPVGVAQVTATIKIDSIDLPSTPRAASMP